MANVTFNMLYLGTLGSFDVVETTNSGSPNYGAETAYSVLNGRTYGSSGTPLYTQSTPITFNDNNNDQFVPFDEWSTSEGVSYTLGGTGRTGLIDTGVRVTNVTIVQVLPGGATRTVTGTVRIMQDTNGNAFLAPPPASGTVTGEAVTTEYPIVSISMPTGTSNYKTDFTQASVNRAALSAFRDGYVDGTDGNDLINTSYTGDVDGDRVDNNDAILPGMTGDDDYIRAGAGNDTVDAGAGNDIIYGGTGADSINGNGGADTIYGESGNDILFGGGGNDLIYGGTGNDSLNGGAGNDLLYGGDGSDTINSGLVGADSMYGEAGDDRIYVARDNYANGGDGDDLFTLNDTAAGTTQGATIVGGETGEGGADTTLGSGGDTLDGGNLTANANVVYSSNPESGTLTSNGITFNFSEIENVRTGSGADVVNASAVSGGTGVNVATGAGADSILGSAGADTINAGTGADTIIAGAGNDVVDMGGTGAASDGNADLLVLRDGFGRDTISHFNGPLSDGNGGYVSIDKVDVTNLHDLGGDPVKVDDVTLTVNSNGDPVLTFPNGESITLIGVDPSQVDTKPELIAMGIPCFGGDTLIRTPLGDVPVSALRVGDLVVTRDNDVQPLRWVGRRRLNADALRVSPNLRPIRIRAGALGDNQPASDLIVSPQHRILIRSRIALKMFGTDEILVAAKQLLMIDGFDLAEDMAEVEYFHLLFDQHEVVISNGAETESLFTGAEALKMVGKAARDEIFAIFPELRQRDEEPDAARQIVSGRMGRKLAARHVQNRKRLVN